MATIEVYLEVGKKRTVASAVKWPGWSRVGKNETAALEALAAYGVRYGRVVHSAHVNFTSPDDASVFKVVEHLTGGATTDFGALEAISAYDKEPMDEEEVRCAKAILRAVWRAFDAAVEAARGKTLTTGPRGGGRDLDKIVEHVLGVDKSHLSRLGGSYKLKAQESLEEQMTYLHEAMLDALDAHVRGEIPDKGPRGGERMPARYFVRRTAWHVLDHVWEIEDRAET